MVNNWNMKTPNNPLFRQRTEEIGILNKEDAIALELLVQY